MAKQFNVDLFSRTHGGYAETATIEAALDRLVPSYYIDRETARRALRDGQTLRTTAYLYRRADDTTLNLLTEDETCEICSGTSAEQCAANHPNI